MAKRFFLSLTLLAGFTAPFNGLYAQGWFYQNSFSSGIEADNNKRLQSSNEQGVIGVSARAGLKVSRQTEISEMYLNGVWYSVRFDGSDDRGVDTDNQLLYAGGRWNGQRSRFGVNGKFLRQSSQLTELTDSGFLQDIQRRVTKSIAPEYTFILSDRIQLSAGASYEEVDFPNTVPVSLSEFSVEAFNASVTYNLNELDSISLSTFHSQYEADTILNESDTSGVSLGYNKTINESWQMFLSAGYRKSNFKNSAAGAIVRGDSTSQSYQFDITKKTQLSSLQLTLANQLQPSSSGDVNERIDVNVNYNTRFTSRWGGSIGFLWFENKSINNNDQDDDREFWQFTLGADYQLTPGWHLTGTFRRQEQKFTQVQGNVSADSDAVMLGIRYTGKNKRFK